MSAVADLADAAGPAPLLSCRALVKRFGGLTAVSGVDLDVQRGEVVALVGDNGAGKSTLVQMISGVFRADSGTIALDGRPIHTLAPHEVKRLGISYVPQGANIFPQLTV